MLDKKYLKEKADYQAKIDDMSTDSDFQNLIRQVEERKRRPLKKLKRMASGKQQKLSKRTWEARTSENIHGLQQGELSNAIFVLTKANLDLLRIEKEIQQAKDLPRRLKGAVQEYQDLNSKVSDTMRDADLRFEYCRASWEKYESLVS